MAKKAEVEEVVLPVNPRNSIGARAVPASRPASGPVQTSESTHTHTPLVPKLPHCVDSQKKEYIAKATNHQRHRCCWNRDCVCVGAVAAAAKQATYTLLYTLFLLSPSVQVQVQGAFSEGSRAPSHCLHLSFPFLPSPPHTLMQWWWW